MTYQEAVSYIEEVPKFTTKNKRSNTVELLRQLGHPEEKLKIIHVAGTNGKGSVCAFMSSALQEAGYRVGLFTSPHLIRINERFQINRQDVADDVFTEAFNEVMEAIDRMKENGFFHPTYFEILFAIGMVIFEKEKVDYLVMETGLGGRLDATNAVAHPILCVITSISLDHTEYLGDTIPQIAYEKAGIIKEGVPVVYDGRDREAEKVILKKAEEKHAKAVPFYMPMAEPERRTDKNIDFVLNNKYYDYKLVTVPFLADYQIVNSSVAMIALRVLDPEKKIADDVIIRGIAKTAWKGRMEPVMDGVVLDGAHNADGIAQFLETVKQVQKTRPVSLLFAAVVEKDYEEMIRMICSEVTYDSIVATQIEGYRKVEADEFVQIFRRYTDAPVTAVGDVREAFRTALAQKPEEGMLFCVGSLYLVGEIEACLNGDEVQRH